MKMKTTVPYESTMAEGSEYFQIGSLVMCETLNKKKVEGEVLAFDPQTKMLILSILLFVH